MRTLVFFVFIITSFLMFSCEEEGTSTLIIRLSDSPGDFEKVFIDIQKVEYNRTGSSEMGWESVDFTPGIYDLLELTGGVEAELANQPVQSGMINQVRLVLGENNTLVMGGKEYPLKTPGAQNGGLKIKVNEMVEDGATLSVLLDFDVARSISSTGPSRYMLKPVIRAHSQNGKGTVKGKVYPAEESVAVYAKFGNNALASSYAGSNSADWVIRGLEEGVYTIEFDPGDNSEYKGTILEDVKIERGQPLDLGEITLELK